MSINKIQYQKGYSLFDFLEHYSDEKQCEAALFNWRWPQGFVCIYLVATPRIAILKNETSINAINATIKPR